MAKPLLAGTMDHWCSTRLPSRRDSRFRVDSCYRTIGLERQSSPLLCASTPRYAMASARFCSVISPLSSRSASVLATLRMRWQARGDVGDVLRLLTPRQRALLWLAYVEGVDLI